MPWRACEASSLDKFHYVLWVLECCTRPCMLTIWLSRGPTNARATHIPWGILTPESCNQYVKSEMDWLVFWKLGTKPYYFSPRHDSPTFRSFVPMCAFHIAQRLQALGLAGGRSIYSGCSLMWVFSSTKALCAATNQVMGPVWVG